MSIIATFYEYGHFLEKLPLTVMSFFHRLFPLISAKYDEFRHLVWTPFPWTFEIIPLIAKFRTGYEQWPVWTHNLYFMGRRTQIWATICWRELHLLIIYYYQITSTSRPISTDLPINVSETMNLSQLWKNVRFLGL